MYSSPRNVTLFIRSGAKALSADERTKDFALTEARLIPGQILEHRVSFLPHPKNIDLRDSAPQGLVESTGRSGGIEQEKLLSRWRIAKEETGELQNKLNQIGEQDEN